MHLNFADRKCMSVIAENSAGEIWLLTKGAESSIIPKCDTGPTHETLKHVMDYALVYTLRKHFSKISSIVESCK